MNLEAAIQTADPQSAPEDALLRRIRDYAPKLRQRRAEIEAHARIPDDIVEDLQDAGAYSMMIPRSYGGMESNLSFYLEVVREIGRGDAGVAWAVSLNNCCNWVISSLFPKPVLDRVFSNPNTRVAGMFDDRAVKARRVEGGVLIEKGMWFFNSGCPQASWDLLAVPAWDEAGNIVGRSLALIPMSDVNILNDWDTSGMRGSGSNNVTVDHVFVPDDYMIDLFLSTYGEAKRPFPDGAVWHSACAPVTVVILTFPMLGAAQHMIEKYLDVIPTREIRVTQYARQSEAAVVHHVLGEASAKIDAAQLLMERACEEIDEWAARFQYMPLMDRARIVRDCAFANRLVWEAVDWLASATSGSFGRRDNVMNTIWQDVKVGSMHPFVSYFSNLEMYGRLLCGITPPMMPV